MNKDLVSSLNKYLANLGVEYVKLHNLHWNVIGINFKAVHEYLESLYDGISSSFDKIAELLKMHFEIPSASLKEYLSLSDIEELQSKDYKITEVLNIVLTDFEKIKKSAEDIRLSADSDDLYDIVSTFEDELKHLNKTIWFIKSMLK